LLAQGFEKTEIVQAIRAARVARTQRKQSNDSRAIAEAVEEARRKLKRLMKGGKVSHEPEGPSRLKLGPTNADLKCQSNGALPIHTINCDRTSTSESSVTTFCADDELPNLRSRDMTTVELRRPPTRKVSHDSLPKMPTRLSLKAVHSDESESSEEEHTTGLRSTTTSLREALALYPRKGASRNDAPRLPARRESNKSDDEDGLLSDASRLVDALDAVNAMVQRQQESVCPTVHSRDGIRFVKPPLPLCHSPSTEEGDEDDDVEDDANRESTFWHSYPTEQAPQAPCRAMRRTPSPTLDCAS
jgi:hypothetical protein